MASGGDHTPQGGETGANHWKLQPLFYWRQNCCRSHVPAGHRGAWTNIMKQKIYSVNAQEFLIVIIYSKLSFIFEI